MFFLNTVYIVHDIIQCDILASNRTGYTVHNAIKNFNIVMRAFMDERKVLN